MNNYVKNLKILSFKVIFQCLKLVEFFQKKMWRIFDYRPKLIVMKVGSAHNFGKSDNDIIW